MTNLIKLAGQYGDARKQASEPDATPHGLTASQTEALAARMEGFLPRLTRSSNTNRDLFQDTLPRDANWSPKTAQQMGGGGMPNQPGGGKTFFTQQRPYQPEYESPDRQMYPCVVEGTKVLMGDYTYCNIEDIQVGDQVIDRDGHTQTVESSWNEGTPEDLVEIALWGGQVLRTTLQHQFPTWAWVRKCLCGCGQDVKPGKCFISAHTAAFRNSGKHIDLIHIDGESTKERVINGKIRKTTGRHTRFVPSDYVAIQKIQAKDLRVEDCLMMPRGYDGIIDPQILPDQARLLGYYVAEGCANTAGSDNRITGFVLNFGSHEVDTHIADAMTIIKGLGADVRTTTTVGRASEMRVVAIGDKSKELFSWLNEHGGRYAEYKQLSAEVMCWPAELKLEVIKGMLRGDGTNFLNNQVQKNGNKRQQFTVNYKTISSTLAKQLQLIFAQLGYAACIYDEDHSIKNPTWHTSYIVHLAASDARNFASIAWGNKTKCIPVQANTVRSMFRVDGKYVYYPIKSVNVIKNDTKKCVYNLQVSGDHSYVIDNIGTYNCHRILANRYWRLFYKLDPVVGNCIDMYGDMPWSQFKLTGPGVEGSVLRDMEQMVHESQLLTVLPSMVKEWFVVGECMPHCFYSDDKGYWTHIALHNPDQLEVIDAPFIKMDPIVSFIPDERLRSVLTSNNPALRGVRESMPPELLSQLQARQNIPLSPVNATFIPRKLHPYDTRGTSIMSRMWRIFMLEDAIFNASIQTARRHACFVAGSQVLMSDGLKSIETVRVGDRVISGNGKVETVEAAWEEQPSPTVTIDAVGTEPLVCTPNHKFPIWKTPRECACGCGELVKRHKGYTSAFVTSHNTKQNKTTGRIEPVAADWKEWSRFPRIKTAANYQPIQIVPAEDIQPYDYLLIPRKFDEIEPDCTLDQARLLGYYLSEGHCSSNTVYLSLGLASSVREHGIADDAVSTIESLGGIATKSIEHYQSDIDSGRKPTIKVWTSHNSDLVEWCEKHGGKGAATKTLSEEVMRWPLAFKRELIKGLYLGDGSRSKCSGGNSHQVAMGLTSRTLINQTQLILAQIGVFSSISPNPKKIKHPEWNDAWIISSTGADARYLSELIFSEHIVSPWGAESHKGMKTWMDDDYIYVPVTKVTKNEILQPVYNLTVSGDHSYVCNGRATRNSPLKVAKLGNAATGWIPGPEHEAKLLQMLAQAELDTNAWLVTHYGVAFETVGTTDRTWTIDKSYDLIERIKLSAMGISKSFTSGEVTYASSAAGLQVFLQRLKAMRTYFEQKWIIPKFFQTVAEINGWVRRSPAEVQHRFRVKRSQREMIEQNRYIIPTIVWEKTLDPAVDANLINAMQVLESMGVKFSKTTKMATVGISFEEESHKAAKEAEFEKQFLPKLPSQDKAPESGGGGGMMGGGEEPPPGSSPPGGEAPPPEMGAAPPSEAPPEAEAPPSPEGAALHKESASKKSKPKMKVEKEDTTPGYSTNKTLRSKIWVNDKFGNWHVDEVAELISLFHTLDTDSPVWAQMLDDKEFVSAIQHEDAIWAWERLIVFLDAEGYPQKDMDELRHILALENLLPPEFSDKLVDLDREISSDTDDSDTQFLVGASSDTPTMKLNGDMSARLAAARMAAKVR